MPTFLIWQVIREEDAGLRALTLQKAEEEDRWQARRYADLRALMRRAAELGVHGAKEAVQEDKGWISAAYPVGEDAPTLKPGPGGTPAAAQLVAPSLKVPQVSHNEEGAIGQWREWGRFFTAPPSQLDEAQWGLQMNAANVVKWKEEAEELHADISGRIALKLSAGPPALIPPELTHQQKLHGFGSRQADEAAAAAAVAGKERYARLKIPGALTEAINAISAIKSSGTRDS